MDVGGALKRAWGEFVGPEVTRRDTVIELTLGALGAGLAPRLSRGRRPKGWRSALLRAMAADLWGGVWANSTLACARWYERPAQTDRDHLRFAATHLHPFLLAGLDGPRDRAGRSRWGWAAATYGYLIAATALARAAPSARRPLGVVLTAGGVALDRVLGPSPVAPWFAPVFYGKLVFGHATAARHGDAALRRPPVSGGAGLSRSAPAGRRRG